MRSATASCTRCRSRSAHRRRRRSAASAMIRRRCLPAIRPGISRRSAASMQQRPRRRGCPSIHLLAKPDAASRAQTDDSQRDRRRAPSRSAVPLHKLPYSPTHAVPHRAETLFRSPNRSPRNSQTSRIPSGTQNFLAVHPSRKPAPSHSSSPAKASPLPQQQLEPVALSPAAVASAPHPSRQLPAQQPHLRLLQKPLPIATLFNPLNEPPGCQPHPYPGKNDQEPE